MSRPSLPIESAAAGTWYYVDLAKAIESVRILHARSLYPASMGEQRGTHYCMACTVSIDDYTAYVEWPCATARAVGGTA